MASIYNILNSLADLTNDWLKAALPDYVNKNVVLLASAARTAEAGATAQANVIGRSLILFVDVTVDAASGAITPTLQIKDHISGDWFTIWTAAAPIAATGHFVYAFFPGCVTGADASFTESQNIPVPYHWKFVMTVADTDSLTYSVSAQVLI